MPAPERLSRDKIDQWLKDAGWRIVPYARWQAGDRTNADAIEEYPTDSGPTTDIWYYEQLLPEGRKNYTKTKPMQYEEFTGCAGWWSKREENERAWKVAAADVLEHDETGNLISANLDIKNPNGRIDFEHLRRSSWPPIF